MRVVPRGWDNETWVCSVRGHVAPAARVARLRPEDAIITRLIACERAVHCLLFTAAALVLAVVDLALGGLRRTATDLSASLQGIVDNSGRGGSLVGLVWAKHLFGVRGGQASEPTGPDWDALLAAPAPTVEEARC